MSQITNYDFSESLGLCAGSKLVGRVGYRLKDKDGNVVDSGMVSNNIVLGVRKPIIKLLAGWATDPTSLPFVRQLALGQGDTAPTILDEKLEDEIEGSRKMTATAPTVAEDGLSVTFSFLYDVVDDNVDNTDIKEMGLFTTTGEMIARTVVGLWRKATGMYFEVYWVIGYRS